MRTAIEIAESVRSGACRAVDVLEECLDAIDARNPGLNAFVVVDRDGARRAAAHVDALVRAGVDPGPFAGVPFGVKDLYDLAPEEDKKIPTVCHSLDMALDYLDKDRAFLKAGGVFTDDLIDAYIELKMKEVTRLRMTTHPIEIEMYYSL